MTLLPGPGLGRTASVESTEPDRTAAPRVPVSVRDPGEPITLQKAFLQT